MNEELNSRFEALEKENRVLRSATMHWEQMHKTITGTVEKLEILNKELHSTLQRLEYIFKASEIAWWDWDYQTGKVIVSPMMAAIAGYGVNEFPDSFGEIVQLIHPEDQETFMSKLQQHLQENTPFFGVEYRLKGKKGDWKWVFTRGKAVEQDILNKPIRIAGIMIDIQGAKSRERSLTEALEHAEAANRDKSKFLFDMSHEIYTPLAGVIGMADILGQSTISEEQAEYLNGIVQSATSLMSVFNDILDYLKIEAGKVEFASIPFSLSQIMEEVLQHSSEQIREKEVEVLAFFDPNIPDRMKGDPVRLKQVLNIFMNNAVKYTEKGHIALETYFLEWNDEFIRLQFKITDTGIGIPSDSLTRIFGSFTKVQSSASTKYGGSGLGLAIAQFLIRGMDWSIQVESTVGEGTVFTFDIQIERYNGTGVIEDYSMFRNWKVLVIDDLAFRRNMITGILSRWECEIDDEDSGINYKMVILEEKSIPREYSFKGPVLLLGPHTESGKMIADKQGWSYLKRPFLPPRLKDSMLKAQYATTGKPVKPAEEIPKEQPFMGKKVLKILLAEDNLINQKVAIVTLKKLGYHADLAENGIIAFDLFTKNLYDLILMDIHMPEMDGITCTRKIREAESSDPERKPVYICAITANPLKDDEELCLNAGMNNYISKPFRLEDLNAITGKLS